MRSQTYRAPILDGLGRLHGTEDQSVRSLHAACSRTCQEGEHVEWPVLCACKPHERKVSFSADHQTGALFRLEQDVETIVEVLQYQRSRDERGLHEIGRHHVHPPAKAWSCDRQIVCTLACGRSV